jgi:hypothetical protein
MTLAEQREGARMTTRNLWATPIAKFICNHPLLYLTIFYLIAAIVFCTLAKADEPCLSAWKTTCDSWLDPRIQTNRGRAIEVCAAKEMLRHHCTFKLEFKDQP